MTLAFGPAGFGAPELLLIVFVLVLLFGAKKLPEMARGSGRALRIFKAETKGLMSDDDDDSAGSTPPTTPGAISPPVVSTGSSAAQPSPPVEPVVPTYSVDEPASRDSDR